MERERLFVPKNSKLYYWALLLSIASVVMKLFSNLSHFGALVPELSAEPLTPLEGFTLLNPCRLWVLSELQLNSAFRWVLSSRREDLRAST